jgi:hypothetical protein
MEAAKGEVPSSDNTNVVEFWATTTVGSKVDYCLDDDISLGGAAPHGAPESDGNSSNQDDTNSLLRLSAAGVKSGMDVWVLDGDNPAVAHVLGVDREAATLKLHFYQQKLSGLYSLESGRGVYENWDTADFIEEAVRENSKLETARSNSRMRNAAVKFKECSFVP